VAELDHRVAELDHRVAELDHRARATSVAAHGPTWNAMKLRIQGVPTQ